MVEEEQTKVLVRYLAIAKRKLGEARRRKADEVRLLIAAERASLTVTENMTEEASLVRKSQSSGITIRAIRLG
ncbi:MAG: hypothetical protein WAV41_00155 [Microgenomates group bacterium]